METITDSSGILGAVDSLIGGREENQDSYGMAETRLGMLAVVCDGMGGGPAGKTASLIATQAIIDYVSGAEADKIPASVLEDAAVSANECILAAVAENPALKGMGTTCVCVLIQKGKAFIMHVGDSRCYLIRGESVQFRTSDHSYVGEMVRRGSMTEEEARQSNFSNVITRALGASPDIDPEVDIVDVKPGDRFALMTDGIWGSMPEPQLVGLLAYNESPEKLVPQIAARVDALGVEEGGGHDNLTLAIVQLPGRAKGVTPVVINDIFGSQRPTLTDRPASRSTENPELGELNDKTEKSSSKKRKSAGRSHTLTWILSVALILAIGVIVWLIILTKETEKEIKVEKDSVEAIEKIVDNRSPKPDSEDADETQQSGNDPKESQEGSANSGNESPQSQIEYTQSKSEKTEDTVIKDTIIIDVIKNLNSLKNYSPEKKDNRDNVVKKRGKIVEDAITQLTRYSSTLSKDKKKNLDNIIEGLRKDAKTIQSVDSKKFLSTKDANDMIDKNVKSLQNFAK